MTELNLDLFTVRVAPTDTLEAVPEPMDRAEIPTVTPGDLCLVDDYQGVHIDDALEVKSVDRHGNPTFLMPKPLNFFFTPPQGTWRVTLKKS